MKTLRLSEIAEIRQGHQFRKKIQTEPKGEIKVIQMANIIENRYINYGKLPFLSGEKIKSTHFLKKDDIIFCSRGTHNYNIIIENRNEDIIAVSQFLIIRPNQKLIKTEYLSWILKQPEAVSYLNSNRLSSAVPLLNKKTLEELTIPVPPLEKQKKISDILELIQREKILVNQIQLKKEKFINQLLRNNITIRN